MLQYLAGIILIQVGTSVLVLLAAPESDDPTAWLPLLVALGMISLIAAFWFSTLSARRHQADLERVRQQFAREREQLRVTAEREKTRLVRENHKTLNRQRRRTESRANMKVGATVAAAAGVGLLMVVTNFITLGLLTMTGAGAALGGYLLHRKWFGQADGNGRLPTGRITGLIGGRGNDGRAGQDH
jgi:hypothetical protein